MGAKEDAQVWDQMPGTKAEPLAKLRSPKRRLIRDSANALQVHRGPVPGRTASPHRHLGRKETHGDLEERNRDVEVIHSQVPMETMRWPRVGWERSARVPSW